MEETYSKENVVGETNWDRRYLELAKLVSGWSKDPKAQVGAIILDRNHHIVALGYNGFPRNVEDSAERLEGDLKNEMVVHAEENAILIAGPQCSGGTMYVVGKPVCSRCSGVIIQARIKIVIAAQPKKGTTSKWDKSGFIAQQMFSEANVKFRSSSTISLT